MPSLDPQILKEKRRRHYLKHAEEIKAKAREWCKKNPEHKKARDKAYYLENRDRICAQYREYSKKRYRENHAVRERQIRNDKETREELKSAVLAQYGNACVSCGFTDVRALQLDHKFGGGCQERKRHSLKTMYKMALATPDRYQILCANCNWIKRAERNELPWSNTTARIGG